MLLGYIFSLGALLVSASGAAGRLPASPEAAMERLVALNNEAALQSEEGKALLAGELDSVEAPGGAELPPSDRVIRTGPGKAAARIPARAGSHPDLYFYLEETGSGWRIIAHRTLALTGPFEELLRLAAQSSDASEETRSAVRNARLVLSSDRELRAWAEQHRDLLGRARAMPSSSAVHRELVSLGGSGVRVEDGIVFVSIGGMVDNEVGFLFAAEGKVPRVDGRLFIWIEPISGGWYLFKTT